MFKQGFFGHALCRFQYKICAVFTLNGGCFINQIPSFWFDTNTQSISLWRLHDSPQNRSYFVKNITPNRSVNVITTVLFTTFLYTTAVRLIGFAVAKGYSRGRLSMTRTALPSERGMTPQLTMLTSVLSPTIDLM
ncbi:conserved hypothetical protein [Xenorhabdus nematophila F1]|uniref:Uncharacterized protein n=1 Tax=Xenorhabdus nematophila (strain ATCC 19061 / DSM 3370 / CCUG 14189 / LMG 1036 / NCIMB 9965 / AN6) TaxID=406817 RepID=D3VFY4_XENNA|nr:hypothetical protein XNC1_4628 [Xenorhabdus nematophila ATCC 19061]CCW32766.1 conserved hypothetical protein [Xenorhabdus nematophila F1]CEK25456.1 hypothetical protein XNC2_4469 [Xenorhabdus nematophila AN6/1]